MSNQIRMSIVGVDRVPSWEALEMLIRTAVMNDDGRFTRISRLDHGANYRAFGEYQVEYVASTGDAITIDLTVS